MKTFRNILLFTFALTAIRMAPEFIMNAHAANNYAVQCQERGFDWLSSFSNYPGIGYKGNRCF